MSEPSQLASLVEGLGAARVLCVGDVMLDRYVYGSVERISPEAPIPVLRIAHEAAMLGGAGNVVRNIAALGGRARLVAAVGADLAAHDIETMVGDLGTAEPVLIADQARWTSIKTRFLAGTQQLMRADHESTEPVAGEIEARILEAARQAMEEATAVVLSDYGKGVLTPAVIEAVLAAADKADIPVIVDPKGRDYGRYRGADIVTPNRRELAQAAGRAVESDDAVAEAAVGLARGHDLGAVVATLGRDGMIVATADGAVMRLTAETREVFDVSGAGDTVVATLACALGAGADLEAAAALANVAAGIVVAKVGTAVAYGDDVVRALHHQEIASAETKVSSLEPALDRIRAWRHSGLKVGFTNGCFDLLHPGHVALLSKAREACDRLVVGLNSDASVSRLKGSGRPVQAEAARAAVLASLASVDMVVIFSEDTPLHLIEAIKPDILVKGADYAPEDVVGRDIVEANGGRVLLVELEPGHSTTATIRRAAREAG